MLWWNGDRWVYQTPKSFASMKYFVRLIFLLLKGLLAFNLPNIVNLDWIHVFYHVRQQVSEQGFQRNKNVLYCAQTGFSTLLLFFILLKNVFIPLRTLLRNLLANRIKHMNSVLELLSHIMNRTVNRTKTCRHFQVLFTITT